MGPVAVDGALARDIDVLLVAHIDQRGGPGHLDAGDARGQHRVIFRLSEPMSVTPSGTIEGDAGFEEERTGEVGSGFEGDGAAIAAAASMAFWIAAVMRVLPSPFGAVVVGEEYFLLGVRRTGMRGKSEGGG